MADYDPRPLTREELAKFLPNQRAIRAFEKLFDLIPPDLIELFALTEEASIDANTALAIAKTALGNRAPSFDYIDFSTANHVFTHKRVGWHDVDDTLHLHHADGTHEAVGLTMYALCENHTGVQINAGSTVGFAGVGTDEHIKISKYLANGSSPTLYVLGLAAVNIPDFGSHGRVIVWGPLYNVDTTGTPYGEVWVAGDILYASPTTAGGLTKTKPTAPNSVVPIAAVLSVNATTGALFVRPTIEQQLYYGEFSKTADASPAAINTAYAITFDTTEISNGIHIDGTVTSRIVADNSGLYSFKPSFQLSSGSASVKSVWLWFRKNGSDAANSSRIVTIQGAGTYATFSRSEFFSLNAGEYIELMWAANDTNVTLDTVAATAFAPAAPSVELSVEQVQQ